MSSTAKISLIHRGRAPSQRGDGKSPLLLLLHGLGSNEDDLLGMAPYLDERFHIVSLRAPHPIMYGGFAWFPIEWTATGIVIDPEAVKESCALVLRVLDELIEAYDVDATQVYLMGFSQGAIMSLTIGLSAPTQVAGVVAMSGVLSPEIHQVLAPPEALEGLPIIMVHGRSDGVLPIQYGRQARDLVSRLPVDLTYQEYNMAHEVSAESLRDIVLWLRQRLDKAASTQAKPTPPALQS